MINRPYFVKRIETAIKRSPITALLGPRQCGKTTLAKQIATQYPDLYFDLESEISARRLENPEFVLGNLSGLVIIDEIQTRPSLFKTLRVLADDSSSKARFLILGSASPDIIRNASETMAGRVEFIELGGFDLREIGVDNWQKLLNRGGFPRSYLAGTEANSSSWRTNFIKTFLERDIPQLGITIPSVALHRFWVMLAHYHGQIWNASKLASSMGLNYKTIQSYLDILTGSYMIRQLQPWFTNTIKRQVKSPKIFIRDTGLLHSLLGIHSFDALLSHPQLGFSWEGFAMEQVLRILNPNSAYFWATHSGAELDLYLEIDGKKLGFEFKFNEAPIVTKSMRNAAEDLELDQLWVIHPGKHSYPAEEKISMLRILDLLELPKLISSLKLHS